MKRPKPTKGSNCAANGQLRLSAAATEHLRAALEQMDLLIRTRHVEVGMCYLLAMLQHMGAVRRGLK